MKKVTKRAMNGMEAAAEALKVIDPEVVAAYPITPTTKVPEKYSQFLEKGEVTGELITVESEHSALSACVGASAMGVRTVTATASQGLMYMFEVLSIASGLRLPILMFIGNRAVSAPLNIHCDHSDSMAARDQGWIQIYCEKAQEVYDLTFIGLRLAEQVRLPVMICQDAFITTHTLEPVELTSGEGIKKFINEYKPKETLLDFKKPKTFGEFAMPDSFFEQKEEQQIAMKNALDQYSKISQNYKNKFELYYPAVSHYKTRYADYIIVCMSSVSGLVKDVVDELRKEGFKAGCLKIRLYRPFPFKEVEDALKNAKGIAVLDRSISLGSKAPLYEDVKNCFIGSIQSYVFGLGGREIKKEDIIEVFKKMEQKDYDNVARLLK
ncbi:pyruvate ferredoxin oxidoreductase [Candidatus Woesearchaeota archaeon]|nr:pyruvate ferredoxin oxidoreductase [Candidatus Woesearchaeota archaeon]